MARFFVNRPIVAIVISIVIGAARPRRHAAACRSRSTPRSCRRWCRSPRPSSAPAPPTSRPRSRRRSSSRSTASRTCIYMKSTNANDGTLTLKVSFEVGSNLDMDNVLTQNRVSQAQPQMPQSVKNYGVSVKKALAFPLLVHLDQVAERHLRQQLPVQLHDDQHQRRHRAHPGRRADQPVRRQRLRDARLAAAGSHRPPRPDHPRHRQRDQPAEPADAGRPDWRPAGGARHRVHLHRPHAGPPAERGGVRQHHRPHQPRRLRGAAEGRRPHRAGHDALQRRRPPRRQAVGRHRGVPDSGHQRARRRQPHQGARWTS